MRLSLITLFIVVAGCRSAVADEWKPAAGPLMTRFAKEVRPDRVWPEYPRPQMVRKDWQNLNGLWQFAVADATRRRRSAASSAADPGAISRRVGALGRDAARRPHLVPPHVYGSSGLVRATSSPALRRRRLGGDRVGQRQESRHPSRRLRRLQLRHHRRPEASGQQELIVGVWIPPTPARSRAASRSAVRTASCTPRPLASGRRCGWSRWPTRASPRCGSCPT